MGRILSIKINSSMHGQRVDYILKNYLKISSSLIIRLKKEKNGITLNGVHATVITKVSEGDIIVVNIKGEEAKNIIPVNIFLDVLWEDEDILVVNKPGTMPVHPSRMHINDTLANAVLYHIGRGLSILFLKKKIKFFLFFLSTVPCVSFRDLHEASSSEFSMVRKLAHPFFL